MKEKRQVLRTLLRRKLDEPRKDEEQQSEMSGLWSSVAMAASAVIDDDYTELQQCKAGIE